MVNRVVFDLEANGLLEEADTIWVMAYKQPPIGDHIIEYVTDSEEIYGILEYWKKESPILIGHNILNFDLPLLSKLYGFRHPIEKVFDTLVVSRLLFPDLKVPEGWVGKPKPHSLEAWAMRFGGQQKVGIEAWHEFHPSMIERCRSDVVITSRLYSHLKQELNR